MQIDPYHCHQANKLNPLAPHERYVGLTSNPFGDPFRLGIIFYVSQVNNLPKHLRNITLCISGLTSDKVNHFYLEWHQDSVTSVTLDSLIRDSLELALMHGRIAIEDDAEACHEAVQRPSV